MAQLLFGKRPKSFFLFAFSFFFWQLCDGKKKKKKGSHFIPVQTRCQGKNGSCWIEPLFSCLLQGSGILDPELLLWLLVLLQVSVKCLLLLLFFSFPFRSDLHCRLVQSKVCTCIHLHKRLNSIPVTHVPPLSHQNTFHFFPQQWHSESPPCSQQQLSVNITSKAVWLVKLSALRHSHADTPHLQKPARRSGVASLVKRPPQFESCRTCGSSEGQKRCN